MLFFSKLKYIKFVFFYFLFQKITTINTNNNSLKFLLIEPPSKLNKLIKKKFLKLKKKSISLKLYYESLCIPSLQMIGLLLNSLDFLQSKKKVFQIELIPFGFSKIEDKKIICNHGKEECIVI